MTRYERFINFIRIVSIFGAIFLVDSLLQKFQKLNLSPFLTLTLRSVSAVSVLLLAEFFASWMFDSWHFLRRLALGDDFLEGVWVDAVSGSQRFGILTISYKDGKLRMNGEQYDRDGNITASWDNFLITLEGRTVRTLYRSPQYHNGPPSELLGFSTYIFSGPPGKPPERYTGYFADSSTPGARCALRGFRLKDKTVLKRLAKPTERHSALKDLGGAAYQLSTTGGATPPGRS